jgi:hypothetical protein
MEKALCLVRHKFAHSEANHEKTYISGRGKCAMT